MKRLLFIIAFTFVIANAEAQIASFMKQGNYLYENMMYAPAINYFESVLEIDTTQIEAKIKLADCYEKVNDSRNTERIYESLIKSDTTNVNYILNYAEALNENGKHQKSLKWYSKYAKLTGNDSRGRKFQTALKNIDKMYVDSTKYEISYLSINSNEPDFSPVIYEKGLVFCSGRNKKRIAGNDGSPFLDLYYLEDTTQLVESIHKTSIKRDHYTPKRYKGNDTEKSSSVYDNLHHDETVITSNDTETLGYHSGVNLKDTAGNISATPVIPFNKLNSNMHEGPFCFNKTQDTMYLTRNSHKRSIDGTSKLNMFICVKKDGKWSKAEPFQYNSKNYSTGHPALTADGKTLYFVSDQVGSIGGADIWYCKWENSQWSKPVNAGSIINTKGNEMFPSVNSRGDLYFASDGHGGMGGMDIFKSIKTPSGTLGNPHNLGYPLNSMKDDFGIHMINDEHGFFSSNRKSGGHDDDLYSVSVLHKDPLWLKGLVTEVGTDLPLGNAFIYLKDAKQKEWIDTSIVAISFHDGQFYVEGMLDYDKEYSVLGTADYHDSSSVDISTFNRREGDTLYVKLQLNKVDPVVLVSGVVMESDTKMPMANMKVVLYDTKTEKITEFITKSDGKYSFDIDTNNQYTISCVKPNCGYNYERISTYKVRHSKAYNVNMDMVCTGDVIVLNDIFYDYDSTNIRHDAALELDKMVPLFFKYPDMMVELSSHADCRGGKDYNLKLTAERAKKAVEYLVSKDVHPSRLTSVGYGEQKPVVKCACNDNKYKKECTEEEYQRNRRTEFKIIKIGDTKQTAGVLHK